MENKRKKVTSYGFSQKLKHDSKRDTNKMFFQTIFMYAHQISEKSVHKQLILKKVNPISKQL